MTDDYLVLIVSTNHSTICDDISLNYEVMLYRLSSKRPVLKWQYWIDFHKLFCRFIVDSNGAVITTYFRHLSTFFFTKCIAKSVTMELPHFYPFYSAFFLITLLILRLIFCIQWINHRFTIAPQSIHPACTLCTENFKKYPSFSSIC